MSSSHNNPISPKYKSNNEKKTVSPLKISKISKPLLNQTSINSPIESSDNENEWHISSHPKRSKSPGLSPNPKISNHQNNSQNIFSTPNRFSPLYIDTNNTKTRLNNTSTDNEMAVDNDVINIKAPPPIFIKSIINNYQAFCEEISNLLAPPLEFSCKTTSNSLKLNTSNPNSYRTVIKYLKQKNVNFYTFQLHDDKPYRVVIRNLHPTTAVDFIKEDLGNHGFLTRNITNVLHYQSKAPLPLFFVDLEPAANNKDIFELQYICYTKIKVEAPKPKKQIPQCMNCQDYGHTRSYCHSSPRCVRCGDHHSSTTCTKSKDLPAKCALCFGDHPANYRGCPALKNIQTHRNRHSKVNINHRLNNNNKFSENNTNVITHPSPNSTSENQSIPITTNLSYAQATQNKKHSANNNQPQLDSTSSLTAQLTSFINDLKTLITPLITLLTKVIDIVLEKK